MNNTVSTIKTVQNSSSLTSEPPATNRGVQNTDEGVTVGLDWLEVTCDVGHFQWFKDWIEGEWQVLEHGILGYPEAIKNGEITVAFGARGEFHAVMKGQGMAQLRHAGKGDHDIIADLCDKVKKVSRLDVAWDCIGAGDAQLLDLDRIIQHCESGRIATRFKKWSVVENRSFGSTGDVGRTLYIGSRSSDSLIRIYDKGIETGLASGSQWIRLEMQLRDQNATALFSYMRNNGIGVAVQLLAGLVEFKQEETETNKARVPATSWWSSFIENAQKVRFSQLAATVAKSIDKARAWVMKQVAPTLAMLVQASGGDLAFLQEAAVVGSLRMRKRHYNMLASLGSA